MAVVPAWEGTPFSPIFAAGGALSLPPVNHHHIPSYKSPRTPHSVLVRGWLLGAQDVQEAIAALEEREGLYLRLLQVHGSRTQETETSPPDTPIPSRGTLMFKGALLPRDMVMAMSL